MSYVMYSRTHLIRGVIAVIGDELFTLGFNLAGAVRYVIRRGFESKELIDKIFKDIYESNVSLVIAQDRLRGLINELGHPRRKPPLVIYVPDYLTYGRIKARDHYLSLIRRYLGISIELG